MDRELNQTPIPNSRAHILINHIFCSRGEGHVGKARSPSSRFCQPDSTGTGSGRRYAGPSATRSSSPGTDTRVHHETCCDARHAGGGSRTWRGRRTARRLPGSQVVGAAPCASPNAPPDYFGPYPNYANSPLPAVDPVTGQVVPGTGMRKFVNSLPGLGTSNANDLGNYIPIAAPDTITYPGSDYYEIVLKRYSQELHKDLPPTHLQGYLRSTRGQTRAARTRSRRQADRTTSAP